MIEIIQQPWPWYIAGPMIAITLFFMLYFGKNFGLSSNLRTMCSIGGGGKYVDFFNFEWKNQLWNIVFLLGTILGGFISSQLLSNNEPIELSDQIISNLNDWGITSYTSGIVPTEIFSLEALFTLRGAIMLIIGGFFVGFGSRYAGGCTSGHAISGLSDLQLPSLIAVIGFFIGGLISAHFILPVLFQL